MNKPKNLLFIIADQWRGDTLGALGHPCVHTPHLDALAAESMVFRRHFTQASPCGPARASILTGMYLFNHRQVANGTPLDHRLDNLAKAFALAGYDPALCGYTDTPLDPTQNDGDEWICPGFVPVAPFLLGDGCAGWRAYLESLGYDVPDNIRRFYGPVERDAITVDNPHPPSQFSAEHSDTAYLVDRAIEHIDAKGDNPWFVHLTPLRPHPPLFAPTPYDRQYDPDAIPAPSRPQSLADTRAQHPFLDWSIETQFLKEYFNRDIGLEDLRPEVDRRMRAIYYGNCGEVDAQVGRLLTRLKSAGAYDDTMIVFCSDHGEQFGNNWLYGRRGYFDGHFHVPLIVRMPGEAGRIVDAFTEHVDLMPTLLEAFDLPVPAQCDGRSLLPFLRGRRPTDWRDAAFFEFDFRSPEHPGAEAAFGLVSSDCNLSVLRGDRYKYVHFAGLPPLLFDLAEDPHETRNVIDDPVYSAAARTCMEQLLARKSRFQSRGLTGYHQAYGAPIRAI